MQVEIRDLRTLTVAQAEEIANLLVQVWPKSQKSFADRRDQMLELGQNQGGSESQAPRSFLFREAGRLIAHSAVFPRLIATSSGEMTIAGLTRVCTAPDQRGRGLGERAVRAAFDLVDGGTFPFSLFQTTVEVRSFYEMLGSQVVENSIFNSLGEDSRASPFWDKEIMRYPAGGNWPAGEIDLRGPGY